jgi:hypothetical protein
VSATTPASSTGAPLAAAIFTLATSNDVRTLRTLRTLGALVRRVDRAELQDAVLCLAGMIVGAMTALAVDAGQDPATELAGMARRFGLEAARLDGDR